MTLIDLFNLIAEDVLERVPNLAATSVLFGEEHLTDHDAAPRIVFVPGADSFAPASTRTEPAGRAGGRAIATVIAALDVHVWGKDYAQAYLLRDTVITSLRATIGPNFTLTTGRIEGAQNMGAGRKYVLGLAIQMPVVEQAPGVVTIEAEEQTDIAFAVPPPH